MLPWIQKSLGIEVTGNVTVQEGQIKGAVVHTILDGRKLDICMVDKTGNYKIDLDYNHKYELIFDQRGNFPQKIVFETLVPDKVLKSKPQFAVVHLDVNLFTEIPGIKISFVENPIRKFYYNPKLDNFISEVYYNDTQIARKIELAVFQYQIISKETDLISKLTRYELAEMKREYDKILDQAGKIDDKSPVFAALDCIASNHIVSKEEFLNFRNKEVNDLLGSILIAAELDKEQSDKFDAFVQEADNLLNQKKFLSARVSCNRALSIKPDDVYANIQSELINDLLEKEVDGKQYKNLIAHADNSFNELLYSVAAKDYQYALLIKPDEQYPREKLEEVHEILKKESVVAAKQKSYKQAMKQGEAMFQKQFYEKSLASFEVSSNLESGNKKAAAKIEEVTKMMNKLADQLMYDKLIASAGKSFRKNLYQDALNDYFAAIELVPNDLFASTQINIINKKLDLEEKFADCISQANDQYAARQFKESKENYLLALEIKSKDKYIKNRIKEIDVILKDQDAVGRYNSSFAEAGSNKPGKVNTAEITGEAENLITSEPGADIESNSGFLLAAGTTPTGNTIMESGIQAEDVKNLNETISETNNHLNERNSEAVQNNYQPSQTATFEKFNYQQINEVENDAELKNIYDQFMKQADKLFDEKSYVDSRRWYYKAWDVKQDENNPKQRIDQINDLLKLQVTSPLEKEYQRYVDLADSTFRNNQYALARGWYNRALSVKANESYPREQLREIDVKITELMAAQSGQQFDEAVQKANNAFQLKNYNVSRFWCKKALELRPDNVDMKNLLGDIQRAFR